MSDKMCAHGNDAEKCWTCEQERKGSFAAPSGSVETWAVVFRHRNPVAAFVTRAMADEWIREAAHRKNDTVTMRKITFRGIEGYPPNAALSESAQKDQKHEP